MGTSNSGTGPGSGPPLVPPWVPDPMHPEDVDSDDETNDQDQQSQPAPKTPSAPVGRFGPARRNIGDFARTGESNKMRRGLGHYVRRGYGGAEYATQRMGGTARTAGILYRALSPTTIGQPAVPGSSFDLVLLAGQSADEIMDAVVEAVRPADGTQDAETGQRAIREALSELLDRFPNADLCNLSEKQRTFVIENYIALDVFNRFCLDNSKTIQDKAPSPSAALSRLKDVKNYTRQTVSAQFRELHTIGEKLDRRRISSLSHQALHDTFVVFEEYIQ